MRWFIAGLSSEGEVTSLYSTEFKLPSYESEY